jgi:CoA:oxalate CoA-transferase
VSKAALDGVRVIDLSQGVSGPYCTKLLAELGAEVIKIEPLGGDDSRTCGPFPNDVAHPEKSALFLDLNRGKQSVTLDILQPAGRRLLRDLVSTADLLVESMRPGEMASLGVGYEQLAQIRPPVVYVAVTDFGQTGPYRDYRGGEMVEQALSGLMSITGQPDREPLKTGGLIAEHVAGQTAFIGAMGALLFAEETGEGQFVDISALDSNIAIAEFNHVLFSYAGEVDIRKGNRHANHPWGIYPCLDGWVGIIGGPPRAWPQMANVIDERLADKRFATMHQRTQPLARDEIDAIVLPWLLEHGKVQIYQEGQAHGLAFSYVATPEDLLASGQLRAREYFVQLDHPLAGKLPYAGAPFILSETPLHTRRAPLLGEHSESIYRDLLGLSKEDLALFRERRVI